MKYIFEVLVNEDYSVEQYADAWLAASKIIQQAVGANGTYLHRDLNNPRRALAIAHWDSKAARDKKDWDEEAALKIIRQQADHVTVNLVGEFADPEWQVEIESGSGNGA